MILAVDTETTGPDFFHGCKPFMITACNGTHEWCWEGEVDPKTREVYWDDYVLASAQSVMDDASSIVFHNTTFDMRALWSIGISISSFWSKIEDTLVAAHCVNSAKKTTEHKLVGRTLGLKDLAFEYLGFPDDDEKDLQAAVVRERSSPKGRDIARFRHPHFPGASKNTPWSKLDYWLAPDLCRIYALKDVHRNICLWKIFKPAIISAGLWNQYRTRADLLEVSYEIQTTGRFFDRDKATKALDHYQRIMEKSRQIMKSASGITYRFDPNKPDHLVDFLHNRLDIPIDRRTDNGKPSTSKETIKYYQDIHNIPALEELDKYKRAQKKANDCIAYLHWTIGDSRTHSNLNITGTRETRQSSSSPNDQNVNRLIKSLFGPPPGKVWICTDMVNIELCIWAYSVGNRKLIDIFESGKSVHQFIMSLIFPDEYALYAAASSVPKSSWTQDVISILECYKNVKAGNFARIYGATDSKTNNTYHGGKTDRNYCAIIDKELPGIREFTLSRAKMCEENFSRHKHFGVSTMGGYRLSVPPNEPYKAANFYVQGSAGWIMGEAMLAWYRHPLYNRYDCHMNSQVHDGLDTEVSIIPQLPEIIAAKIACIENAGLKYLGTCGATYELLYNPQDKPLIDNIL